MLLLLIAYTICNLKPICYQEHPQNSSKSPFKNIDILDREKLDSCFKNIDWVFHLAGIADIVPSIENPTNYFEVNNDKLDQSKLVVFSPGPGKPKDYPKIPKHDLSQNLRRAVLLTGNPRNHRNPKNQRILIDKHKCCWPNYAYRSVLLVGPKHRKISQFSACKV